MHSLKLLLGTLITLITGALGGMISSEIRARLDKIPIVLLTFTARRLPARFRNGHIIIWQWQLNAKLEGTEEAPITRLVRGTGFVLALAFSTPQLKRTLIEGQRIVESSEWHWYLLTRRGCCTYFL